MNKIIKEMLKERDRKFRAMPLSVRRKALKWEEDVSRYLERQSELGGSCWKVR